MGYTLEDLIKKYAEHNEMSEAQAKELYKDGRISKYDLLEAYLHDEGIYGYTSSIWSIFETLAAKD